MHLMIFTQTIHLYMIQDNKGQRIFSTLLKKDRFLDLITNFENTTSHKYVVQKAEFMNG